METLLAQRQASGWAGSKHPSSEETDVLYQISNFAFDVAKFNPTLTEKNGKRVINLSYGEPTRANGYYVPENITEAVIDVLKAGDKNGYAYHAGPPEARQAIVEKYSKKGYEFEKEDVFFTGGGHGALFTSIHAMCSRGENILIPKPSFPLTDPICQNLGVEIRYYNQFPEKNWEIDLDHMRSLIDAKTKAILVCNPSNPCSVVFSKEHQLEIIKVAQDFKIPLLCDEVYYGLVYPGHTFESFANLTDDVPMVCLNSLSKVYQVPGWRLGWIIVYNRHGHLDIVKDHISKFMRIPFHPCSLIMHALPRILKETPQSYLDDYCKQLATSSEQVYAVVSNQRGLNPIKANAGMYMMVKLNFDEWREGHGITDDKDFVLKFWEAESILLLPSQCFFEKGFVRIVTCISKENADELGIRLARFMSGILKGDK
ncbi:hypothetical protein FGO68_gene7254 [Halteria grandinella]|uniref:Aminotransferase class I/classII large domain-containing protein n=1 Tax=Halteria grandinella TaxID=5974 RepID=A0A8J8NP53_HALGN|nr:hypothetical protein FGO68_gene7254 [Halteria grandinella]